MVMIRYAPCVAGSRVAHAAGLLLSSISSRREKKTKGQINKCAGTVQNSKNHYEAPPGNAVGATVEWGL